MAKPTESQFPPDEIRATSAGMAEIYLRTRPTSAAQAGLGYNGTGR